jgi:hypothetical protein
MLRRFLLLCVLGWWALPGAHAHLVVSQHGTLNIVHDGAYMVLSLPVSALTGIDDDADGRLSLAELRAHAPSIESQIRHGVSLSSEQGTNQLDGVMLSTIPPENAANAPADQIAILGRFALDPQASDLTFSLRLFGAKAAEQTEQITVTRGAETQLMTLTPAHPGSAVLPATWRIFVAQIQLGASHVLSGADHMLFLLVVLATGWQLGQMLLALTCFTAGHALTLVACAWWGLAVPSALVEPAIAATIVGMALYDRWASQHALQHASSLRLGLVFACALIHGLGLAGALAELGLDPGRKVLSLAGFNLGIELGQITVAVLAGGVVRAIGHLRGPMAMALTTRLASIAAMTMGAFWFVERIVEAA